MKSYNHRMAVNEVARKQGAYEVAPYQRTYEAAPMKRYHVISISVLIGLVVGLSVPAAKAVTMPLSFQCETTAPYEGHSIAVAVGHDLSVGGAVYEIDNSDPEIGLIAHNHASNATLSRNGSDEWDLTLASKVTTHIMSAHCKGF